RTARGTRVGSHQTAPPARHHLKLPRQSVKAIETAKKRSIAIRAAEGARCRFQLDLLGNGFFTGDTRRRTHVR
ncbi:MAG TPA: hypothetical protein VM534_11345, partial [Thermoanaerobaculia bacterium]|nr:hypothetical protein [Thermoanaerobaculia bacterium]